MRASPSVGVCASGRGGVCRRRQAFKAAFALGDYVPDEPSAKRPKSGAPKAEKAAPPSSLAEWISALLKGELASLTIPLLKEFCKGHGLPVGGKKDDLLARVTDFLEAEMAREQEQAQAGAE